MTPSEFHSSRKFVEMPFGRIAYVERGSGRAALFLHGLPLCGYQRRDVLEDLAPIRRCVAPDAMGLGYTEVAPGRDVSFAEHARMIAAFLDAAKIDRVDLVGNDTGAGISQIFAAVVRLARGRLERVRLSRRRPLYAWEREAWYC
jgi:haloalkane dehalogenase